MQLELCLTPYLAFGRPPKILAASLRVLPPHRARGEPEPQRGKLSRALVGLPQPAP